MLPQKECLEYYNHTEELTYSQIGMIFDVCSQTVCNWFKKYNIKAKNNQRIIAPKLSPDIIKRTAEKNRKYNVWDYKGKSELIDPENYKNSQSIMTFKCQCGNIFKTPWWSAHISKNGNICKKCVSKLISETYRKRSEEFRQITQERKKKYNRSAAEKEVYGWIKNFYPNAQHSFSLGGKNYDILIPELKLLIEYNGLYFHSEEYFYKGKCNKDLKIFRKMHAIKKDIAIENGYRCFQIFEDDWRDRKEAVQNFLLSIFNINKIKVMARKCKVVDVPKQTTNEFLDRHHLQGMCKYYASSIGLIFNDELIAVAVFAKEGEDMNLVRYAVDGRYAITGGFAKLISHFQKSCNKRIITFADMTYVNEKENVYLRNGFKPVSKLAEDYKYIIDEKRYHKFGFRRANLSKMLGASFDPSLSEYENCVKNEIYRIWDAGKIKYIKD